MDLARLVDLRNALKGKVRALLVVLEQKKEEQTRVLGSGSCSDCSKRSEAEDAARRKRASAASSTGGPAKLQRSVFGQLVGHLNKALLEEAKQSEVTKRQRQRLEDMEARERQRRWAFIDDEIRELELSISEKSWTLDRIEAEISAKIRRSAINQVIRQWSVMENFIRTAAEPCLFWMPCRHNSQTRRLQDDTKHEIQQKLKHLLQSPPPHSPRA